jgi:hypothetical protein
MHRLQRVEKVEVRSNLTDVHFSVEEHICRICSLAPVLRRTRSMGLLPWLIHSSMKPTQAAAIKSVLKRAFMEKL